ncbi:hypothetical protein EYF80_037760 [Liparis tanakae]|uniref:Uncharacterized protein n=1 Tax=Liparis tanakae TaxID=230148 RepID=A0A4Z2GFW2_9TELE|nr:hypothetical protein EYF80_037760 [Liparis tanakae]
MCENQNHTAVGRRNGPGAAPTAAGPRDQRPGIRGPGSEARDQRPRDQRPGTRGPSLWHWFCAERGGARRRASTRCGTGIVASGIVAPGGVSQETRRVLWTTEPGFCACVLPWYAARPPGRGASFPLSPLEAGKAFWVSADCAGLFFPVSPRRLWAEESGLRGTRGASADGVLPA